MARVRAVLLAAGVAAAVVVTTSPAYAAAAPTTVTGLAAAPADSRVTLTWTNPADADFAGVTVVQKDGTTAPATTADGTTRYTGTGQSVTVTGLTNGASYSFAVFTRNTAGDVSSPATLTSSPVPALVTDIVASVSPGTVAYGTPQVVTAVLTRSDTGEPLSGEAVDFYRKAPGQSSFVKLGRIMTNTAGIVRYAPPALPTNFQWYLQHPGTPYLGESKTATFASHVAPRLSVRVSRYVTEQGVPSVVSVAVAPTHAGHTILLQLKTSDGWQNVAGRTLSTSGTASFAVSTYTMSTRTFRLAKSADYDHVAVATSPFSITVIRRTLRAGMSGSDVTAVQKRLAALHYDVGVVNGYYGFDTTHAAAAFQKVQGLPVNGAVDARTYDRLLRPAAPRLRYSHSGAWIEADLTKQVLYYVRNGAVARVLDISSGSGNLFTVDGETQRAVTPTGNFRIFHKIDGLRISRLGSLWRPAYFASGGFAIHGNGSVPYYPASHGCIRITIPAMNRLFSLLTIGMPVHVYRS